MSHSTLLRSLLILGSTVATLSATVLTESGSITTEIERIKNVAFVEDSNLYVAPDSTQLANFKSMADALYSGDTATADTFAGGLNYEIVQFTDTDTSKVYFLARETLNGFGDQTLGWGTYIIRNSPTSSALVEVPHLLHDTRTWQIGGSSFHDSNAKGFLMAGAHRSANGTNTADVAHLSTSAFETVHEAWTDQNLDLVTFSVHGFDVSNHGGFPSGTDFVLSNGDGGVSNEVVVLDAAFDAEGYESYAYNSLLVGDALNVSVNGAEDGSTFSGLAATTTVQRIYSSSVGATFVHVEIERTLRFSSTDRVTIAGLLTSSITSLTAVPESSTYALLLGLATLTFANRRRPSSRRTQPS